MMAKDKTKLFYAVTRGEKNEPFFVGSIVLGGLGKIQVLIVLVKIILALFNEVWNLELWR